MHQILVLQESDGGAEGRTNLEADALIAPAEQLPRSTDPVVSASSFGRGFGGGGGTKLELSKLSSLFQSDCRPVHHFEWGGPFAAQWNCGAGGAHPNFQSFQSYKTARECFLSLRTGAFRRKISPLNFFYQSKAISPSQGV
jgi:hypothetical protein